MFARIVLFVLMGVGLTGFGVVAWINLHPAAPPPSAESATPNDNVSLLIAAKSLRAGALLKPDDLAVEQRPAKNVPPGGQIDTEAVRSELLGAMIRRNLARGEAVLSADALNPGDRGFLAAVLGSGMRAVTVGVDAVTGLAGLVWPGDRIDLILSQSQEGSDVPPARRVSAETVLHDVRVLAIDRQLIQGATSESPETQAARTVTLEVTPADAERVVVGARLGHLSLSVVAFAQAPGVPAAIAGPANTAPPPRAGNGITWGGDVSSALHGGESRTDGPTVRLFRGASESKEIHF
jgi:pilus assembly protein CpaB